MSVNLAGRVALVTGGASGIGRAVAVLLARHGARVWVGDTSPLAENQDEFQSLGIHEMTCDVRNEEDISRLMCAARGAGPVSILVCNAGIGLVKQIPEVSLAEWQRVLDTNLTGAFLCSRAVIPEMQSQGGGAIVMMSSNAGLLPRAHDPAYSTSKGALIALTKSLALSHARDKIRVNAVCPGPVENTRLMNADLDQAADRQAALRQYIAASPLAHAHGRMITPQEVAEAVLYLVSDLAVMVTGTCLAIDGGKSLGVPPPP